MTAEPSLSYREAGVDIDAGNELVERIKPAIRSTRREGSIGGIGGFGGLFELPLERYRNPLLVSGTDGVGTKLKLASELGRFDGIGIDLVAMCANDIAVLGAEALFFLDYYATGQLQLDQAQQVIEGIAEGCRQAGCALIGGETAEMPGVYAPGDFDLAGFCVGIVERDRVIDGSSIRRGDRLLALASSGVHSNGFSLVRKVVEISGADFDQACGDDRLGTALLTPTRIYVKTLLALAGSCPLKGIVHVTGGGLVDNLPRILPADCSAAIDLSSWQFPDVFAWLQQAGGIEQQEMLRTFNCGAGMVIAVAPDVVDDCLARLRELGETAWQIGEIVARSEDAGVVFG